MRETTKVVTHEVEGEARNFRIQKMNALHGSYLMKFCAEKLLPVFNQMQESVKNAETKDIKDEKKKQKFLEEQTQNVFSMLPSALAAISEDELFTFEKRCLGTVEIESATGWVPIMRGDKFQVGIIEYDTMTVLLLCYDVLEFNLSGFFGGNSLASLLQSQATSPSNA